MTTHDDKTRAHSREITRLVNEVRALGDADSYTGKRHNLRFTERMQLEVTMDTEDSSAIWSVTMHDVSEGGFSFWSRRKLESNTAIFLREFSADNPYPWLPAHVRHTTQTVQGYLIGATFDEGTDPSTTVGPTTTVGKSTLPPQPAVKPFHGNRG